MGRYELEHPKDTVNLKRHGERASSTPLRSFMSSSTTTPGSPFPVILPMINHMDSFDRPSAPLGGPLDFYLHGCVSARMFNASRFAGMPVCVAASHVDGLLQLQLPFGRALRPRVLVESEEERLYAMELVMNSPIPSPHNRVELPQYASAFCDGFAKDNRENSIAATRK
ncbi:pyridoxamine 5'-phosphate oxidase domain-containing protein [Hirsutella rhossiliensis]|uniref:Pyridoxamine 5'-phosphate oxidase domain-containing protein n=1 Tax=Hirsutella rhossiliensis TaxID=111463 RepID=A0A9P8SE78_9HYPO|nr:pyridoxamine 5'-phosphate oxidase domain-containing protein [Hirsutella rhossiliensis]KAH0958684.1 pyridoxamine 5'-phosphate oxidase domain-containing protein [Hirsutella rhossiliensis]